MPKNLSLTDIEHSLDLTGKIAKLTTLTDATTMLPCHFSSPSWQWPHHCQHNEIINLSTMVIIPRLSLPPSLTSSIPPPPPPPPGLPVHSDRHNSVIFQFFSTVSLQNIPIFRWFYAINRLLPFSTSLPIFSLFFHTRFAPLQAPLLPYSSRQITFKIIFFFHFPTSIPFFLLQILPLFPNSLSFFVYPTPFPMHYNISIQPFSDIRSTLDPLIRHVPIKLQWGMFFIYFFSSRLSWQVIIYKGAHAEPGTPLNTLTRNTIRVKKQQRRGNLFDGFILMYFSSFKARQ